jgi:hypothetical protein
MGNRSISRNGQLNRSQIQIDWPCVFGGRSHVYSQGRFIGRGTIALLALITAGRSIGARTIDYNFPRSDGGPLEIMSE